MIKHKNFSKVFFLTIIFSASFSVKIKSQTLLEGGPILGVSWYNGDLNPQRQFYNMQPAFGGFVRLALNDRLGYKGSLLIGGINGEYPAKNVLLNQISDDIYTFDRKITDVTVMFEFNMFSFDHPFKPENNFTPYMTFGLGGIFYKRYEEDEEKPYFVLSLPFGAGVKWKMKNKLRIGMEWTMRKTFADDLDKVGFNNSVNPANPYAFNQWKMAHNNDWISFVNVYVSFTIFNRRTKCEAGYYD